VFVRVKSPNGNSGNSLKPVIKKMASSHTKCSVSIAGKSTHAVRNKHLHALKVALRMIVNKYEEICGEGYLEFSVDKLVYNCLRDDIDISTIQQEFKKYNVSW